MSFVFSNQQPPDCKSEIHCLDHLTKKNKLYTNTADLFSLSLAQIIEVSEVLIKTKQSC